MQPNTRSNPLCSRSEGNSLVELVVVITLLGLLCSFAIPRFRRLENDVRASEVVALSVNLRSASAAAHAQYVDPGGRLSSAPFKPPPTQLNNPYPPAPPKR